MGVVIDFAQCTGGRRRSWFRQNFKLECETIRFKSICRKGVFKSRKVVEAGKRFLSREEVTNREEVFKSWKRFLSWEEVSSQEEV